MVLTPSTMRALGTKAPEIDLQDVVSGRRISLKTFEGCKALLVMFICRHCPYVQHVKAELGRLGKDYAPGGVSGAASAGGGHAPGGVGGAASSKLLSREVPPEGGASDSGSHAGKGLGMVAVSSNDAQGYPEDSPESLREMAVEEGWNFPLCFDETQQVARAYAAACTPDFFLFDESRRLVYRGQMDDSRPGSAKPVSGRDLRAAVDAALAGRPVSPSQKPSMGCNIKWKKGNEPTAWSSRR